MNSRQIALFAEMCSDEMKKLGYDPDAQPDKEEPADE
jgi:hypothetical protein